ncbi:hypothetical protein IAR55_003475 [Kwoniella newhampshirensis]|uniref:Uncharacterized protein n=1 Tax=Kwoniella newhampshirensis TaxID=1651941 RepID=A0AAW0YNQ4_9TREE
MVSTRPSPTPARGRIAYPSAATYTPGDADNSPTYIGAAGPIHKTSSRDSDGERAQGLKTWWKGFRERERNEQNQSGIGALSRQQTSADVQAEEYSAYPSASQSSTLQFRYPPVVLTGHFTCGVRQGCRLEVAPVHDSRRGDDIPKMPFRNVLTMQLSNELSVDEAIVEYKDLIQALPRTNLYLLLYVLDLLSVFSRQADQNLMTAPSMEVRKDKVQTPTSLESPPVPTPPAPVKADADLMLPSDSDDDVPEGGYYVIEGQGPKRPTSPMSSPPTQSLPSLEANLIPPPPNRAARPTQSTARQLTPRQSTIDMEPSDSDEEAPPGGYEVRTGDFSTTRANMLGKSRTSETSQVSLTRRRTVPSQPGGGVMTRIRRDAKEAP